MAIPAKDKLRVGFIGLGTMGAHMAANLQAAGYKLIVHDLGRQRVEAHLKAGATWADTPGALASGAKPT
jgi:3-hydroxyisobutyrate dehydrogenase-like beta-hydroxyacid dehydrogenase